MAPALIELTGVTVRFDSLVALHDVGFMVPEGRVTALIGPNGAGKTTCFNVISGLQRVTVGRVRFGGRDITHLPPHRRRGIGRTFQIAQVFGDMTVLENVLVGLHSRLRGGIIAAGLWLPTVRRQERWAVAHVTDLLQRVALADVAERQARTLPLGQQRLLELARALAGDPQLVLLDEAASGLSPAETEALVEQVKRLRGDRRTVLLVEHNMRFVHRVADHLIVLNYGRVIYEGPVQDGVRHPAVISAYLGTGLARA
jgi:branched-chain amino acid transport system ATP-binding protein